MGMETLTFGKIEIEKKKIYHQKLILFLGDVDTKKVLVSNKISFGKRNINTLLVTCTIIIKLSHYM